MAPNIAMLVGLLLCVPTVSANNLTGNTTIHMHKNAPPDGQVSFLNTTPETKKMIRREAVAADGRVGEDTSVRQQSLLGNEVDSTDTARRVEEGAQGRKGMVQRRRRHKRAKCRNDNQQATRKTSPTRNTKKMQQMTARIKSLEAKIRDLEAALLPPSSALVAGASMVQEHKKAETPEPMPHAQPSPPPSMACPTDFPHLELSGGRSYHGDVCRRSEAEVGTNVWQCPSGCTKINTTPWCKMTGTEKDLCLIPSPPSPPPPSPPFFDNDAPTPDPTPACSSSCRSPSCANGPTNNGGVALTNGVCHEFCSREYNGVRYCGAGAEYEQGSYVSCANCGCGSNCKTCTSPPKCGQCEAGYLLRHDGTCGKHCPPGFVEEANECRICTGKSDRRRNHARSCQPCLRAGEIGRIDHDDCQHVQDTCDKDQCEACAECLKNVAAELGNCPTQGSCYNPGGTWCPAVARKLVECQGYSYGCYNKMLCESACICTSWKDVFCGGRVKANQCPSKVALMEATNFSLMEKKKKSRSSPRSRYQGLSHGNLDSALYSKCGD